VGLTRLTSLRTGAARYLLCAVPVIGIGICRAEAASNVCFEPVTSVSLQNMAQTASALQAKGCGAGDVLVATAPVQIKAGLSLVAATFCDYRGTITMFAPTSSDTSELSCVLGETRRPKTSRSE
jgi:hypothetical protein